MLFDDSARSLEGWSLQRRTLIGCWLCATASCACCATAPSHHRMPQMKHTKKNGDNHGSSVHSLWRQAVMVDHLSPWPPSSLIRLTTLPFNRRDLGQATSTRSGPKTYEKPTRIPATVETIGFFTCQPHRTKLYNRCCTSFPSRKCEAEFVPGNSKGSSSVLSK